MLKNEINKEMELIDFQQSLLPIKDIYNNLDLYGSTVLIMALKNKFKGVAMCLKSIPSAGSMCGKSTNVKDNLTVNKAIFHRNNEVTILTDKGNLRFF